jgi:hypothetical protein
MAKFSGVFLFLAVLCFGQTGASKLIPVRHFQSPADLADLAKVVRVIAEAPAVAVDAGSAAILAPAAPPVLAIAEWLVQAIDRPDTGGAEVLQFAVPGGGDDWIRVYRMPHETSPHRFSAMANGARAISRLRAVAVFGARNALVVRGPRKEVLISGWVVETSSGELRRVLPR